MLSHVWFFVNPWTSVHQASLSTMNSQSLLRLVSIESVMPSKYLILCHPLLILSSVFTSIRVFSNESALCIRWPKYMPSNEYSGLISSRVDWFDLLAVQGTLESLLSWKASILYHLAFFMVQIKTNKWDLIKLTNFCTAKEIVNKQASKTRKRQLMEWERKACSNMGFTWDCKESDMT